MRTSTTAALGQTYVTRSRSDRLCDMCGWIIPASDPHIAWRMPPWMHDGDSWWTGHAHALCDAIYQAAWEPLRCGEPLTDPSDFRSEYLAFVVSAEGNTVEWAA